MELYEPKETEKSKAEHPIAKAMGRAVGLFVGYATYVALETTVVWAILSLFVWGAITWVQVFGVLLVVNGVTAKFKDSK